MTRLPAPSRWPLRNPVNLTQLGIPRPEAIVSRFSFTTANRTELLRPTKLQELLIHLGCTFRMPLENIRITNITLLGVQGIEVVSFDKTLVNLNSNGSIVCIAISGTNRTLRGRMLQTTSGSNVNIDYAILNPSDDILSLSDSEFSSVVASSPLTSFQDSIGAAAGAPATAPDTTTSSSTLTDDARVRIGLGVGLGITGFIALAAVGVLVHRKTRYTNRRRITNSVHVVYAVTPNPIGSFATGDSDRRLFSPIGARV